jgi:DNA-binding CsgD family transcriptional regulator
LATERGRFDLACEAWIVLGEAARRQDPDLAATALGTALQLSSTHHLLLWQVRALAELGRLDRTKASDPTRFLQARPLAVRSGMAGTVAELDLSIGACVAMRDGFVPAFPFFARADARAGQLHLTGLHARTRVQIVQCLVHADDHPLPGRSSPADPSEVDVVLADALALGQASTPVEWGRAILGTRAWFRHGDAETAVRLCEEGLIPFAVDQKETPWWGVWALLRTVIDADAEAALETLAANDLIGHHANRAALAYGGAVLAADRGLSAYELIDEAEEQVRHTPFIGHLLRTIIAPRLFAAGIPVAEKWLLEADAFCAGAGERGLQRRVRHGLMSIGVKVPRALAGTVPPHLARLGLTSRETEVLRLVNRGLNNADIADRLVISVRTVETHLANLLRKSGCARREQLPSADVTPSATWGSVDAV